MSAECFALFASSLYLHFDILSCVFHLESDEVVVIPNLFYHRYSWCIHPLEFFVLISHPSHLFLSLMFYPSDDLECFIVGAVVVRCIRCTSRTSTHARDGIREVLLRIQGYVSAGALRNETLVRDHSPLFAPT